MMFLPHPHFQEGIPFLVISLHGSHQKLRVKDILQYSWGMPEWLAEQLPRGRQLVGGGRAEAWGLHLLRLALRLTPSPSAPGLLPIPALPMPHLPEFPTSWHASEGSFSPSESQISGSSKKKKINQDLQVEYNSRILWYQSAFGICDFRIIWHFSEAAWTQCRTH